ncbi:spermine synthase [Aquimonas sp.]|jgi:spermidine synthase|uniref:spermine/spermidine synthase domain-containing protein n=1 Tax=Aquimonas sp. TaxID=1872588 RepID=UPI0037BFF03B
MSSVDVVAAPPLTRPEQPQRLYWMLIFFVASGVSGLIYQSLWSQYLSLLLGSSAYAQSLVLSIFMGGMATGAWLAAHFVGRIRNLLLAYGLIEGIVGLVGVAFHALFLLVSAWLYSEWLPSLGSPEAVGISRWVVAAALILPQTILLGMTFPIMSAGLMRWMPQRAGAVLGGLYFYNSIGAAAGALLATFVLVPAGGLPGAMGLAGILNLLILAGVWFARVPARSVENAPTLQELGASAAEAPARSGRDPVALAVLLIAGLTGLSSFMYEVGWIRMLSLALGTSQHAFELMLAAFIGGLALGGLYVRGRLDQVADPMRYAGYIQLAMGLAALATLPLYDHAFLLVSGTLDTLAPTASGYLFYNLATASVAIAIMLPAAFFAGMTLPVLTFVLLRRGAGERAIGHAYAINTLGAIIGVICMVHFAMPAMGLKLGMVFAASIDLVLGLLLLWMARGRQLPRRLALATAVSIGAIVVVLLSAKFDPMRLHSGVYRTRVAELDASRSVLYQADGKTASIALHGIPNKTLTIATNGKPDASLNMDPALSPTPDEPTMIIAALLGLAANPQAREVANIGFGSGLTTHVFASDPRLSSITTVEIEPRMVDAARGFGSRVAAAFDDPRSKIVIDDARAYFSGQAARYDIIVSEPSNPWVAGVAKLFSIEFYAFVKRHLKPDGLLVQWVQAYEISDATLLTVLRALDGEFDDYALYLSNNSDIIIVASPTGALPELDSSFLLQPELRALADLSGIRTIQDLRERKLADRSRIRPLLDLDAGPVNSDFQPILAHWAPRDRYMHARAELVLGLYRSPMGVLQSADPAAHVSNGADASRDPKVGMQLVHDRRYAEELAAALNGESPAGPRRDEPQDLRWLGLGERLRGLGSECLHSATPVAVNRMLIEAYNQTAAFLPPERLLALWSASDWLRCEEASLPAAVAPIQRVLASLARRDWVNLRSDLALVEGLATADLAISERRLLAHVALLAAYGSEGEQGLELELVQQLKSEGLNEAQRFELRLTAGSLHRARAEPAQLLQSRG